jgi:autotransporter-associated beta strand protein
VERLEDRTLPTVVYDPQIFGPNNQGQYVVRETVAPLPDAANGKYTLLQAPDVYLLFWGSYWTTTQGAQDVQTLVSEAKTILASSYLNGLNEYEPAGQSVGQARFASYWIDGSDPNTSPNYQDSKNPIISFDPSKDPSGDAIVKEIEADIKFFPSVPPSGQDLLPPPLPATDPSGQPNILSSPIYAVFADPADSPGGIAGFNTSRTYQFAPPIDNQSADINIICQGTSYVSNTDQRVNPDDILTFSHELAERVSDPINQDSSQGVTITPPPNMPVPPFDNSLQVADQEPEPGGQFHYAYRLGGVNGSLVQPYWSQSTTDLNGGAGAFIVPVNTQRIDLSPIWNLNTANPSKDTFTGNYNLTISANPAGRNNITIGATSAGGIDLLLNGEDFQFEPTVLNSITINGSGGDDVLALDNSNGPIPTIPKGITYAGNNQNLVLQGANEYDNFLNEVYFDVGGPSISIDGTVIHYSNVQSVQDAISVSNMTFNYSNPNLSEIDVAGNGSLSLPGVGVLDQINDGGKGIVTPVDFANKSGVQINGYGGNTLVLTSSTAAVGLDSLTFDETFSNRGNTFQIDNTPANAITEVNCGKYGDAVNVQRTSGPLIIRGDTSAGPPPAYTTVTIGSLAPVLGGRTANINGPVTINGTHKSTALIVDDTADTSQPHYTIVPDNPPGYATIKGEQPHPLVSQPIQYQIDALVSQSVMPPLRLVPTNSGALSIIGSVLAHPISVGTVTGLVSQRPSSGGLFPIPGLNALLTDLASLISPVSDRVQQAGTGSVASGVYTVQAALTRDSTLSGPAFYSVYDGTTLLAQVPVAPGAPLQVLGAFAVNSGTLQVNVTDATGTANSATVSWVATPAVPAGPITETWTGLGTNPVWSDAANWDTGTVPYPGDDLVFPAGVPAGSLANNNDLPDGTAFHSITFSGGGYNITGNPLSLSAGITATNAALTTDTFNLALTLTAAQTLTCTNNGGILVLGGPVDNGGFPLTVDGPGTTYLTGAVSDAGGLIQAGTGVTWLTAANTYTGTTEVNKGDLFLSDGGTANDTAGVDVRSGGQLTLDNGLGANIPNRLGPAVGLTLDGGIFIFQGQASPINTAASGETLGTLTLRSGLSTVDCVNGLGVAATLSFAALVHDPGAVVDFEGELGLGTLGTAFDRILFQGPPALHNGILPYAVTEQNSAGGGQMACDPFVTYDPVNGIAPFTNYVTNLASAGPTDNVMLQDVNVTLAADTRVNSLTLMGNVTIAEAGHTLTIGDGTDGGLLAVADPPRGEASVAGGSGGDTLFAGSGNDTLSGGTLNWGTAEGFVYAAVPVAIDSTVTGSGGLTVAAAPNGQEGLVLSGNNSYTGATTVNLGDLEIDSSQPGSPVTINPQGTLIGLGTVGSVTADGGTLGAGFTIPTLYPAAVAQDPGSLTVAGNVTLDSATTFVVALNGLVAATDYNQLNVPGPGSTVTLDGCLLSPRLGFQLPSASVSFPIINNGPGNMIAGTFRLVDPVTGAITDLPEGAVFTIEPVPGLGDARQFRITYQGGPYHNSVVLTSIGATALSVGGFSSPVLVGTAGSLTVTALYPDGSPDTNYTGTVHFTSTDNQATLPPDYTFIAADQGTHTFSITLNTAGLQSLTATDTVVGTVAGTQAGIVVHNPPPAITDVSPTSAPEGGAFTLLVSGSNFTSNSVIQWSGQSLPTTFVSKGGNAPQLQANVTSADLLNEEGTYPITVFDPNGGTSGAWQFTVTDPAPQVTALNINPSEGSAFSGPVATFTDPGGSENLGDYSALINWGDPITPGVSVPFASGSVASLAAPALPTPPLLGLTLGDNNNELAITGYSWGASSAGAGTPSLNDFTLTLAPGAVEPGLWGTLAAGTHLDSVTVHVRKIIEGGSLLQYQTYRLEDVTVASFTTGAYSGNASQDTLRLHFGKVIELYVPPDGGPTNLADYDQVKAALYSPGGLVSPALSSPPPLGLTLGGNNELALASYSWDANNTGTGTPSLHDFMLTLAPGSVEPGLWGALVAGTHLGSAAIHVRKPSAKLPLEYLSYTLQDVTISGFTTSEDGSGSPQDTLRLHFGEVSESYSPPGVGPANVADYNQATATSVSAGSLAAPALPAAPLGLTLGGNNELALASYSWDASNTGTGTPNLHDFTLTLAPGSVEPGLWGTLAAGTHLGSAAIHVRKPSATLPPEYLTYTLQDVTISGFTTSADSGNAPQDTLQLHFGEVSESYSPAGVGAANVADYNQATGTRVSAGSLAAPGLPAAPPLGLTLGGNNELALASYSWDANNTGTGTPSLHDFMLTLAPGSVEPGLWGALVAGTHLGSAAIHVRKPSATLSLEYLTYTLQDVTISGFTTSEDGTGPPQDTLRLHFGEVSESYSPPGGGPANVADYNQATATSVSAGSLAAPALPAAPPPLGLTLGTNNELAVASYSWDATNAGTPSLHDFTLTLAPGSVEPGLWGALAAGTHLPSAAIHVRTTSVGNPLEYLTYTLQDVTVTSFATSEGSGGAPQDSLRLHFGKVSELYRPSGTVPANLADYDQAKGIIYSPGGLVSPALPAPPPLGLTLGGNNEMAVTGYSWGPRNSGAGTPTLNDLSLLLAPGIVEPGLWGALVAGTYLPSAVVHVRAPSATLPFEYLTYTLQDVTISGFSTGEDGSGAPQDTLQLHFGELTESYSSATGATAVAVSDFNGGTPEVAVADAGTFAAYAGFGTRAFLGTGDLAVPGTISESGGIFTVSGSHTYAEENSHPISVIVQHDSAGPVTAQGTAAVAAAPPTATVAGPASAVPNEPLTFTLSASSPSPVDQVAGFSYTINWEDGTPVQIVPRSAGNGSSITVSHTYSAPGTYAIQVTATDQGGTTSAPAGPTVQVTPVLLSGGNLQIGGTSPSSTIVLTKGSVIVSLNGTQLGEFTVPGSITIYGGTGDNTVLMDRRITNPISVYGGGGNNILEGGGGSNLLVGGSGPNTFLDNGGTNTILGGPGRNTLIPGGGTNTFQAAAGTTPLTVTATDATRLYGAANPAFSFSYSGFLKGDGPGSLRGTLTLTTPATAASDTGTYAITPSGLTSGKYTILFIDGTLTVTPAPLTVTANSASRPYGTANPNFTGVVSGVQNNDPVTVSYSTLATSASDVGASPINAALSDGGTGKLGDYSVTIKPGTLTITPANQTITWATPAPIIYGTALSGTQLHATVSVIGPAPAGALTYSPSAGTILGPGFQTLTVAAAATNDYSVATASVTLQVEYVFSGFLAPLNSGQALELNRTIPIKFQLSDANGASITSLSAVLSLRVLNGSRADVLAGAGKTGLRYDPTANQFVYNWQTKGLSAGTYIVTLALADGTTDSLPLTLSSKGAFQLADGATSGYVSSTANQILYGALTVAVQDDTGAGIDPNELSRINDAMSYLNAALGSFGVNLTWAAPGTAADVHIHFASSTPEGGAGDGVLGFTTADNDVYFVEGWNFSTAADPTQVGAGQYDFQTLATHELAHTVGLGESSDPGSVMYEYLSPGTARRTFTVGNLTAINTDADRFMKVERNAPRGGVVAAGQLTSAVPGAHGSRNGLPWDTVGVAAWTPVLIDPTPAPGGLPGPVGSWLRADMPAEGGDDILVGGVGDDLLVGGAGQNLLVGGFAANRPANTGQDAGLSALDALMVRGWSARWDPMVMPDVPTDVLPSHVADESFL